jgi:threonylcarbamoyladenosine tRNA methylthiotransferase MtaB
MKVYLDTIGCRLNQSEIERIGSEFRANGHEITADPHEADLVVVNTCAVTGKALADSRRTIRRMNRAGTARIAVTGCWATLEPSNIKGLPGVEWIIPNAGKDHLVADILQTDPVESSSLVARQPLPGDHFRTRAFIKVQDGCENHCTFCVTRIARGASRSRTEKEVLKDIQSALDGGTQEIVLTGVNLGSWGRDFEQPAHLKDLIEMILSRTSVPRVRLSSIEPWDLEGDLLELWKERRMCRQLHIPLQSGSDRVLKRMGRKITRSQFTTLVNQARSTSPDIAITTDMIVGFPGESNEDFHESMAFVRQIAFSAGHVFVFSPRPGTPAYELPERVPAAVGKERSLALRNLFAELNRNYRSRFIGRELSVLWEMAKPDDLGRILHTGHSDNYIKVEATLEQNYWNQVQQVAILQLSPDGLVGIAH